MYPEGCSNQTVQTTIYYRIRSWDGCVLELGQAPVLVAFPTFVEEPGTLLEAAPF